MTLKEGKGDQPPSPRHGVDHWSLIYYKKPFLEIKSQATVLAPGEAVLFFERHSLQEGFLYNNAWDVEFSLRGLIS